MKTIKANVSESVLISELDELIKSGEYKDALAALRGAEADYESVLSGSLPFMRVKAQILNLMGDYTNARKIAVYAYRQARSDSDHDLVARIQTEIARAELALGHPDLAQREYRDVIAAYRRSGNIAGIIDTLNRMAQLSFIAAEFKAAEKLLIEALDYAQKSGLSDRIAKLNGNLGRIASMLGDYNQAVKYLSISITKNTELKSYPNLCRGYLSLAYAELHLGNFDSARKSLRRAFGLIEKHNLTREYGIYYEYLAELEYELGNWEEALASINTTLEYAYKLSSVSALISQGERLKADILLRMEKYPEASRAAQTAFEAASELGENLETGAALRVQAELAFINKDADKARENIYRAIDLIQSSQAKFDLARAYLAAYRIHRNNIGESQHYLQLARELFAAMKLSFNLNRNLSESEESSSNYEVASADGSIISIITSNRNMKAIMRAVDSIKESEIPILIGGETGTGKDQLAKYIHYSSRRSQGPFISVNCAAIPHELAESELFGHVKGSFTNALDDKDGLILAAEGGTLFLNEIGELSPSIQAKLLGVLENKKVLRIGDHIPREVNFRLICATNRDLEEEIRNGSFRQDLYFRIAVMTFDLPSLAQRGNDILELIAYFLRRHGFEISVADDMASDELRRKLRGYDWPGNIRELRNEINLLALSYPGDTKKVLSELAEKLSDEANQTKVDKNAGLVDQMNAFERNRILEALEDSDFVIRKAAVQLKMPEATLRSKIKKHKITIA